MIAHERHPDLHDVRVFRNETHVPKDIVLEETRVELTEAIVKHIRWIGEVTNEHMAGA